jgi:hypothetical protein
MELMAIAPLGVGLITVRLAKTVEVLTNVQPETQRGQVLAPRALWKMASLTELKKCGQNTRAAKLATFPLSKGTPQACPTAATPAIQPQEREEVTLLTPSWPGQ